jgi:hypothetical protein
MITAPPSLTLDCPADTSTNSTGVATASDGCSTVTIGYSDAATNNCGGTKVIARTWTATDACGNSASAVQMIAVRDTTPPSIIVQSNRVVQATEAWTFDEPVASDTCGSVTVTVLNTSTNQVEANGTVAIRTWQATDACGNSSFCQQTVTVQGAVGPLALAIVAGPQSQTAVLGSPVTLTVTTTGTGQLTYQWVFNGNEIAGATDSALSFDTIQFTNAGLYSVIVGNSSGQASSATAVLDVVPGLSAHLTGSQLRLDWAGPWILQSAEVVTGPYTDVVGATSPYYVDVRLAPQKFFRLRSPDFELTTSINAGKQVVLNVAGVPGVNFVLQATCDLLNWVNLQTNTAPCTYIDLEAAGKPMRFYRAIALPLPPAALIIKPMKPKMVPHLAPSQTLSALSPRMRRNSLALGSDDSGKPKDSATQS